MHLCMFFLRFFSCYYRVFSRAPRGIQHVLLVCLFCKPWCVSVNLRLPIHPSTPSSLTTTSRFSTCVSLFLFCKCFHLCLILDPTSKWCPMVFVFLWLTLYDNFWVHPCCYKGHYFILFYDWVVFHCMYVCVCVCVCVCVYDAFPWLLSG